MDAQRNWRLNGDGTSDLLFENASGEYAIWDLNGAKIIGGGNVGNPGAGWTFQGIADLNSANHADIVFASTTNNTLATWEMNNTSIIGGATIGDAGSAWRALGI